MVTITHKVHVFHDVGQKLGRLVVWTKFSDELGLEHAAFFSEKPPGKPWDLSPLVRDGSVWHTPERIDLELMPGWNALLDAHLKVRDQALRGR